MDNSPTFFVLPPERDNAQTDRQVCRLAAHSQCPQKVMTANNELKQSSNIPYAEEAPHRCSGPHHGRSMAVKALPPIQNNPQLSSMGYSFIGAIPEFERPSGPLDLSPICQSLLEGAALTSGLSLPSSPRPLYDVHEFLLILKSLDAVLELPFPASDQVRTHTPYQPARPIEVI